MCSLCAVAARTHPVLCIACCANLLRTSFIGLMHPGAGACRYSNCHTTCYKQVCKQRLVFRCADGKCDGRGYGGKITRLTREQRETSSMTNERMGEASQSTWVFVLRRSSHPPLFIIPHHIADCQFLALGAFFSVSTAGLHIKGGKRVGFLNKWRVRGRGKRNLQPPFPHMGSLCFMSAVRCEHAHPCKGSTCNRKCSPASSSIAPIRVTRPQMLCVHYDDAALASHLFTGHSRFTTCNTL